MKNLGIRARITLLVLSVSLPALALAVYGSFSDRAVAESHARAGLKMRAALTARELAQIVEGARQTLVAVSQFLPALHLDQRACNEYFANLLAKSSGLYHSMGLFSAQGELFCNGVPWQGKVSVSDRLYFQRAVSTRAFSVGEYQFGRVTRRHGINFGYPVIDGQGKVTAVAFIALDLDSFNRLAAAAPLQAGGIVTVVDGSGTVLALASDPALEEVIGRKLRAVRVRERVLSGREGLFAERGADGVEKLFAYQGVMTNADGSTPIRVIVSVPLHVIFAEANAALIRDLVVLLIATMLLLAAAWFGAERLVLRSIRKIVDTASRVRAGDLSARTGFHDEKDELRQAGAAFDQMAQTLEQRDGELKRVMRDLREQSITDPLTGLYNRRYLLELLPRELMRAGRNGTHLALIMADLDHFKRINDSFGHDGGDVVLRALGGLLKEMIRGSDIACRVGGEEFLLVFPEATVEGAARRAESIRAAVRELRLEHLGRPLGTITASFGVAVFPDHAEDADKLLRAADECLYRAKDAGRDRVVVSSLAQTKAA